MNQDHQRPRLIRARPPALDPTLSSHQGLATGPAVLSAAQLRKLRRFTAQLDALFGQAMQEMRAEGADISDFADLVPPPAPLGLVRADGTLQQRPRPSADPAASDIQFHWPPEQFLHERKAARRRPARCRCQRLRH